MNFNKESCHSEYLIKKPPYKGNKILSMFSAAIAGSAKC